MNNDLISRSELKKAIMELPNDNPSYYYTGDLLDKERVIDEIDNAPTVEIDKLILILAKRSGKRTMMLNALRPKGEWFVVGRAAYGYVDTGGFVRSYPKGLDVATNW